MNAVSLLRNGRLLRENVLTLVIELAPWKLSTGVYTTTVLRFFSKKALYGMALMTLHGARDKLNKFMSSYYFACCTYFAAYQQMFWFFKNWIPYICTDVDEHGPKFSKRLSILHSENFLAQTTIAAIYDLPTNKKTGRYNTIVSFWLSAAL